MRSCNIHLLTNTLSRIAMESMREYFSVKNPRQPEIGEKYEEIVLNMVILRGMKSSIFPRDRE